MKGMISVMAVALIPIVSSLLIVEAQTPTAHATLQTQASKMNVAILIFEGVQIIDYTGPYEVLASGVAVMFIP